MNPVLREPRGPARGELVGPWRILELLDSGTYGSVYRASLADRPEADDYAFKLAHYAEDERFEREAELLRRIRHPNVPRYYDRGVWLGPQGQRYPYVVMQRVEGVPLYEWARNRNPTQRQVCRLLAEVAGALAAIHEHGTHRDVKGDNVLVDREGRAMLVDLGMGFYPEARPITDTPIPPGTEPYRSHQLLRFRYHFRRVSGARYTYRREDDVYALGVMAYRLVTGTYPPAGTDPECADDPERLRPGRLLPPGELASVGPELDGLILRMLSERPEERGTASELARAFEEAAKRMGRAADAPIRASPSMAPTERATNPGPRERPPVPAWLSWISASLVGGLVMAVVLEEGHRLDWETVEPRRSVAEVTRRQEELRLEELQRQEELRRQEEFQRQELQQQEAQQSEAREAERVGLADAGVDASAVASVIHIPQVAVPPYALGLPLPKKPFPGQRKPPCRPHSEVVLLGACWTRIDMKPPCGDEGFEADGRCVVASFDAPPGPTSEPP